MFSSSYIQKLLFSECPVLKKRETAQKTPQEEAQDVAQKTSQEEEEEEESLFNRKYMVWETSIKTTYGRWHRGHPRGAQDAARGPNIVETAVHRSRLRKARCSTRRSTPEDVEK